MEFIEGGIRVKRRILALLMLAFLLVGCGAGDVQSKGENTQEEGDEDQVTIRFSWWGSDERNEYTQKAVKIFEEQNPDIKVEMEYQSWSDDYIREYTEQMESGTEADLMQINYGWIEKFSPNGDGYYDLNTLKDYIRLDAIDVEDRKFGKVKGNQNALPISMNMSVPIFNKTIYKKYGMQVPATWEELFQAASKMSKDGVYPLCMERWQLLPILCAHYEQISGIRMFRLDGGMSLDADGIEEIMDFYNQLISEKVLYPVEEFNDDLLSEGKAAGICCWANSAGKYMDKIEERGDEGVLGEFLQGANQKIFSWYMKPATMYAISKNTTHPTETAKLLDFMINSKEMALLQKTEKGVPLSQLAETALMEAGELYTTVYKASVLLGYKQSEMQIIRSIMEDREVFEDMLVLFDEFRAGKKSKRKISEEIWELYKG